jgi:hypothetical protein
VPKPTGAQASPLANLLTKRGNRDGCAPVTIIYLLDLTFLLGQAVTGVGAVTLAAVSEQTAKDSAKGTNENSNDNN